MSTKFVFDDLTKIPTILATNRAKRTDQTGAVGSKDAKPKKKDEHVDFFAKGNEHLTPEAVYQDSEDWNVRVFPNKYPLLADHEIIVHSPDGQKDIEDLPQEQNVRIIRAMLNRTDYFAQQDKEVFIFNNRGGKAGASLLHPHSQITALKGFPGILETEKEYALHYYNEHTTCFWCDMLKREIADKSRVVYESAHYVLIVPIASRWSYELMLLPKRHNPNFGYMNEMEINDLAFVLKAALTAYNRLFERPDRNFWIHTQRYEPYHWHMGFIPHIKVFGGLELGAGIWVSDKASPEDAAKQLGEQISEICDKEIKTSIGE
ncbi:galactose-1-phosphate uridylyltransferase [Patescibacteria group bacterium]|nr:galactose-1-phosphate uridylyltransferase [Patescibacteria group bacterium]